MTSSLDSSKAYECERCQDQGYIVDGWTAKECSCLEQKKLMARMKNAMIPEEFVESRFDTYRVQTPTQEIMMDAIKDYLRHFEQIKDQTNNSLGFIAKFGEQRLRETKNSAERARLKQMHNNFGLGKTHLQVAAAKWLIKHGYSTLIVSDVSLMEDLSRSRNYDDDGIEFSRLLGAVIRAKVLIWDDIGKAKKSEFRLDMYYQIINERYKAKRPILYSSNEDMETLTERIGDASASRLFGMSKERIYAVEGQDYRLKGA